MYNYGFFLGLASDECPYTNGKEPRKIATTGEVDQKTVTKIGAIANTLNSQPLASTSQKKFTAEKSSQTSGPAISYFLPID